MKTSMQRMHLGMHILAFIKKHIDILKGQYKVYKILLRFPNCICILNGLSSYGSTCDFTVMNM